MPLPDGGTENCFLENGVLCMSKKELAADITREMFENDMFDENNYPDAGTMLYEAQKLILKSLQDYIIISGTLVE